MVSHENDERTLNSLLLNRKTLASCCFGEDWWERPTITSLHTLLSLHLDSLRRNFFTGECSNSAVRQTIIVILNLRIGLIEIPLPFPHVAAPQVILLSARCHRSVQSGRRWHRRSPYPFEANRLSRSWPTDLTAPRMLKPTRARHPPSASAKCIALRTLSP